jgi:hypothetical protein
MGVMFKYLDVARNKAEIKASLIQANLLSGDLSRLLRSIIGKKPSTGTMVTLFTTPVALGAQNGEFGMSISCKPLADRINISWLGLDGERKSQRQFALAQTIFDMLVDKSNLKEPSVLQEKILAELKHRNGTTFGTQSRINKKKGIITFKKFQQILDDYYYKTGDKNIYRVSWQDYFLFGLDIKEIDGNFVSGKLLAFLFDVEPEVVQEDYNLGELNAFLEEIGETKNRYRWLFSKKTLPMARCKAAYKFRKGSYGFSFNYINRRVEGFEFFGQ